MIYRTPTPTTFNHFADFGQSKFANCKDGITNRPLSACPYLGRPYAAPV